MLLISIYLKEMMMSRKFQVKGCEGEFCFLLVTLVLFVTAISASHANAALFYDDFEDGNTVGWSYSNTSGTGDSGVSLNGGVEGDPENNVAWDSQVAAGKTALTRDFDFDSNAPIMFDMQARANQGGSGTQGYSGVTITFLDSLNLQLGQFGWHYGTDGTGNLTDQNWHSYSATMAQLTTQAGTNLNDPAKMSVSFWSEAQTGYRAQSYASVYFDNVNVTPEPASLSLLTLGGIALLRRKRS
jgi:hypothetical protein